MKPTTYIIDGFHHLRFNDGTNSASIKLDLAEGEENTPLFFMKEKIISEIWEGDLFDNVADARAYAVDRLDNFENLNHKVCCAVEDYLHTYYKRRLFSRKDKITQSRYDVVRRAVFKFSQFCKQSRYHNRTFNYFFFEGDRRKRVKECYEMMDAFFEFLLENMKYNSASQYINSISMVISNIAKHSFIALDYSAPKEISVDNAVSLSVEVVEQIMELRSLTDAQINDKFCSLDPALAGQTEAFRLAINILIYGITTGLRSSDLVTLSPNDFVIDGDKVLLNKINQKTNEVAQGAMPKWLPSLMGSLPFSFNEHSLDSAMYVTYIDWGTSSLKSLLNLNASMYVKHFQRIILFTLDGSLNTPSQWMEVTDEGKKSMVSESLLHRWTNHSMRSTATTHLFNKGVTERLIRKLTTHKSDAINKYIHVDESLMQEQNVWN